MEFIQAKRVACHFLADYTSDVEIDDRENDFNLIPERNMLDESDILQSTTWDDKEGTINNDKDMLTIENFMPLGMIEVMMHPSIHHTLILMFMKIIDNKAFIIKASILLSEIPITLIHC